MKIYINRKIYTAISDLIFAPEIDLSGSRLPINEFRADIRTDDAIDVNRKAKLYDDNDYLWAEYEIVDVYNVETGIKRIVCQSPIALLSKKNFRAVMYNNEPVNNVIATLFRDFAVGSWYVDVDFANTTITGYFPEQTARERLQQICFVIGAYVNTSFINVVSILALNNSAVSVNPNRVYWRPKTSVKEYVTKITAKVYSYTQGTPASTDEWVEANGVYYIESSQEVSLVNEDVPDYVSENELYINDVKIINNGNVSDILSRLSNYYFNRQEVECSILNNGEYKPGDRIQIQTSETEMKSGYIETADFTFGLQAKSKLTLVMCESMTLAILIIRGMWNDRQVGQWRYSFPVGYGYSIDLPFVDRKIDKHRYIFRPENSTVIGEMTSGKKVVYEDYDIALDYYERVLSIVSVDGLSVNKGVLTIE